VEYYAPSWYDILTTAFSSSPPNNTVVVGGEVPRLVAVEGEVADDGRYDSFFFYHPDFTK
jgi:hypothetical protein